MYAQAKLNISFQNKYSDYIFYSVQAWLLMRFMDPRTSKKVKISPDEIQWQKNGKVWAMWYHWVAQAATGLLQLQPVWKGRDALIGSVRVTFSPFTSLLPPVTPLSSHSPPHLPWHCWRWVAPKSRSGRRLRLQRRLLTCFNNFLPSSANLCKYFSPVSSSLEGQLRVCLVSVTDGERTCRQSALVLLVVLKVLPEGGKCYWWGERRKVWNEKRIEERGETKFRIKALLAEKFSAFYKSFMWALMFTNGHICFPTAHWDYCLTVMGMSDSKVRLNKILLIQNCQMQNVQTVVALSDGVLTVKPLTIVSKKNPKSPDSTRKLRKKKGRSHQSVNPAR